jgi:hypothetical protein
MGQENQRAISSDGVSHAPRPLRLTKLYKVKVTKSWPGLHDHLLAHAALQACVDKLENAGYSYQVPTGGAVFTDEEKYTAALVAGGELKPCDILVTPPYLKAVKEQFKTAPRVPKSRTQVRIRDIELLAKNFGADGEELRTDTHSSSPLSLGGLHLQ